MAKGNKKKNQKQPKPPSAPLAPPSLPQAAPAPAVPLQTGPPQPPNDKPQLDALLKALETERKSRVLVYWTSDMARVSEAAVTSFYDQLDAIGHVDRLDVLLFTRGGDTEVPWRLVSMIREYCDHFAVLVPHRASSAGTLLAMGADEIVMTSLGVLGPIDPSRSHPLLPKRQGSDESEHVSVQDMRHAMQFIRDAAGSDQNMPYTPEAMATIFTALFDKIHPLAIGAIEQSYALSKLIGARCLGSHMDKDADGEKISRIVDTLCDEYKSHAYQIGRGEAREIGLNAVDAPPNVDKPMMDIYKFYVARPVVLNVGAGAPKPGDVIQSHIAWLDSTTLHIRVEASAEVQSDGTVQPLGDRWAAY